MHITEGIITGAPAVIYTGLGLGLVGFGASRMKRFTVNFPENKPLLGMAGAIIFFISLIPIPAFTGTCSHPCGTPFIAILLGPAVATALSGLSLLLQAAFFAHGGFGTWGANVVSLGFIGSLVSWGAFRLARLLGLSLLVAGMIGGLLGDLAVYGASGLILGTTLSWGPSPQYPLLGYLVVIYGAYLPTQLPIAIGEMFLTGLALHYVYKRRPEVLAELGLVRETHGPSLPSVLMVILFMTWFGTALAGPPAAEARESLDGLRLIAAVSATEGAARTIDTEKTKPFTGMDEQVNERLAAAAGRPPSEPFINTEAMGDLWNALLLLAGGVCGFIVGRWWHLLFDRPGLKPESDTSGSTSLVR